MKKFKELEIGSIALIQQTETGRILQVAMTTEQSKMLHIFLGTVSQNSPLVQMGEDHDLILKSNICKRCRSNNR